MQIEYKKRFQKNFKKLPFKVKEQFYSRLNIFLTNPYAVLLNNHSVDKAFPGCRSISVSGDYRQYFRKQEKLLRLF